MARAPRRPSGLTGPGATSWRPTAIFLVIGGLLLALAYALKPEGMGRTEFSTQAALSAAFVFLTVASLNLLWSWLGGDPIATAIADLRGSMDLLKDSERTGVQRILPVSGSWSYEDWMDRLKSATERVDLMGFNLLVWRNGEAFEDELLRLIGHKVRVRVLILDRQHPFLDGYMGLSTRVPPNRDRLCADLDEAKHFFNGIDQRVLDEYGDRFAAYFELRTAHEGKMAVHVCRIDDELLAIPYLFSVKASQGPLLLVRGHQSKLFRTFQNEFDQLWTLSAPGRDHPA